jgi:hypothetical protein
VQVGLWLVDLEPYSPTAIGYVVVWGGLWAGHAWWLRRPDLVATSAVAQMAVLAGAAVGLVALALGVDNLLRYGLEEAYTAVAGAGLAQALPTESLRSGLVLAVLAVPVWWWHWLRTGVHGPRSGLWHGYVMLVAVLGGLLTAVIAGALALHSVLQWWFGDPTAVRAAVHFEATPAMLAAAVVGLAVWGYHRWVHNAATDRTHTEPERAFGYLVSAVALLAASAGVTMAISAALLAIPTSTVVAGQDVQRNTLVIAATLLLVGAPLWWRFWQRLQRQVQTGTPADRKSVSRRVYLFLLFGLSGVVAVISLVAVGFTVFRELFEGTLTLDVLRDTSGAIGQVATAAVVSAYHWTVHRGDQAQLEPETLHPRSVLLVSADGSHLAEVLAEGTGAKVRRLHRLDTTTASEVDAEQVAAAVLAAPYERVMVTVGEDGEVTVIPYETL